MSLEKTQYEHNRMHYIYKWMVINDGRKCNCITRNKMADTVGSKLKRRGYRVVVLDCYEEQPAYQYADEHRIVDILDKERVYDIAKNIQRLLCYPMNVTLQHLPLRGYQKTWKTIHWNGDG